MLRVAPVPPGALNRALRTAPAMHATTSVDSLSFTVAPGELVLLTGPSDASVSFLPIDGGGFAVVGGPLP